jgi:hypothetical protein
MLGLHQIANRLIKKSGAIKTESSSSQLQSQVHPEILFRTNTINLLISRRGVGKTFTVLRELIKLSQLPHCAGYTTFLYVSDKTNDETVNDMVKLIKLKVRRVTYNDVLVVLQDLIDAKSALADALDKDVVSDLSRETVADLMETLDLKSLDVNEVPHTAILLDDAINVLKEAKFKELRNLLFQNRQPRLTIFICVQDLFGLPVQLRRNCDTIFLFAGMTDKLAFGMMLNQLGIRSLVKWEDYSKLPYRTVLVVDYLPDGIKIKLVT